MGGLSELISTTTALSIPFMLGVVVGRGFKRTNEPTLHDRFGRFVQSMILKVVESRQFCGPVFDLSVTEELEFQGRKIEIVVRERA